MALLQIWKLTGDFASKVSLAIRNSSDSSGTNTHTSIHIHLHVPINLRSLSLRLTVVAPLKLHPAPGWDDTHMWKHRWSQYYWNGIPWYTSSLWMKCPQLSAAFSSEVQGPLFDIALTRPLDQWKIHSRIACGFAAQHLTWTNKCSQYAQRSHFSTKRRSDKSAGNLAWEGSNEIHGTTSLIPGEHRRTASNFITHLCGICGARLFGAAIQM